MALRSTLGRLGREQSGMTLIELLVTITIAILTAIALFTLQEIALRQTGRVFARVDATRDARNVIEKLESRMHSACIAEGVTPIRATSSDSKLVFISKYGSAASLTPELHEVTLNSSAKTLVDKTYPASGGSAPNWTFSSTPTSTVTLLSNVVGGVSTSKAFTYYPYGAAQDSSGTNYVDAAGNPYVMLLDGTSTLPAGIKTSGGASVPAGTMPANSPSPVAVPLTSTSAQSVAAVGISLLVSADGKLGANQNYANEDLTVSDSVVLRITPVPSDSNQVVPPPCE